MRIIQNPSVGGPAASISPIRVILPTQPSSTRALLNECIYRYRQRCITGSCRMCSLLTISVAHILFKRASELTFCGAVSSVLVGAPARVESDLVLRHRLDEIWDRRIETGSSASVRMSSREFILMYEWLG